MYVSPGDPISREGVLVGNFEKNPFAGEVPRSCFVGVA